MFKRFIQRFKKNLPAGKAAGLYCLARMEAEHFKQEADRMRCFEYWFRYMVRGEIQAIEEQGKEPSRIVVKYSLGGCHDTIMLFDGIRIVHDPKARELISIECEDGKK